MKMTGQRSTGVRLGSFALILASTFGTAYALGERLPGHNHPASPTHNHVDHEAPVDTGLTVPFTVVVP